MGRPLIDMTGKTYGRFTVESRAGWNDFGHPTWNCVCECGERRVINGADLRCGKYESCGCVRRKHGCSTHPLYNIWTGMIARCSDPDDEAYEGYGGRGIKVCDRWQDVAMFIEDMAQTYSPGLTIDRRDNDGDYCKENCHWTTMAIQAKNRRDTRLLTHNGETLCASDWANKLGISKHTIYKRLDRGMSVEESLTKPVRGNLQVA